MLPLAIVTQAIAADIDVVATQTAMNPTFGVRTLSANQTWTKDNVYIMKDRVYVPNGITLTIEAGTKIYSSVDNKGTTDGANATDDDSVGVLIIARGGQLFARGTEAEPIVFGPIQSLEAIRNQDSPFDPDTVVGPAPTVNSTALWGGVIMLGNASISLVDSNQQPVRNDLIEGFTPASAVDADGDGFSDILEYGYDFNPTTGTGFARDDADSSGELTYVSIRHGGYNFSANNEINGLTLGGVGSGTRISYVEVISNEDDGVEFFGGTVNTDHILVAFCKDDSFDIDQGHSGTHQFWFAIQNTTNGGDNNGEWDGVDTNVSAQGLKTATNVMASNPQIFNVTFVGPGANSFPQGGVGNDNGIFLDDNFNGSLRNSILHDSVGFMASFSSDGSFASNGFAFNTIGSFGKFTGTPSSVVNNVPSGLAFYQSLNTPINGNTAPNTSPGFKAYTRDSSGDLLIIDPRPTTVNASVAPGAPVAANYRGAFDSTTNWAAGWTKFSTLGYFGGAGTQPIPAFADTDGDGLPDFIETALAANGFDPGVAQPVLVKQLLDSQMFFTQGSLQDLSADDIIVEKEGSTVQLTIPVEKSNDLTPDSFEPAGNAVLTVPDAPADKQFYRFRIGPNR